MVPAIVSRNALCGALVVLAAVSAAFLVIVPGHAALVWVALYTIPSHVLATPLPQEPGIFYGATLYAPMTVTLVVTAGALFSAWLDYQLLTPWLRRSNLQRWCAHPWLARPAQAFARQPFGVQVLIHLLPVPSAPFKFLSIASGYPLRRYLAALIIGRAPRYYMLAQLGAFVNPPLWLLALALALLLVVKRWRQ